MSGLQSASANLSASHYIWRLSEARSVRITCLLCGTALTSASMTKTGQKKAVKFTRMCKFWRTNECKMGADCTFAHSTSELRPSPKPCFDFVKTGRCTRGQDCRFVHSDVKINGNDDLGGTEVLSGSAFLGTPPSEVFEPEAHAARMSQLSHVATLAQTNIGARQSLRAPPGMEDTCLMAGLLPRVWSGGSLRLQAAGGPFFSSLAEVSLGLERAALPTPTPADVEQMWAAVEATGATHSLTTTMCWSTTPSSFSETGGPEGTSFWM